MAAWFPSTARHVTRNRDWPTPGMVSLRCPRGSSPEGAAVGGEAEVVAIGALETADSKVPAAVVRRRFDGRIDRPECLEGGLKCKECVQGPHWSRRCQVLNRDGHEHHPVWSNARCSCMPSRFPILQGLRSQFTSRRTSYCRHRGDASVRDAEGAPGGYALTVVVAVPVLSAGAGSSVEVPFHAGLAVSVPAAVGWTMTMSVPWAPLRKSPRLQVRLAKEGERRAPLVGDGTVRVGINIALDGDQGGTARQAEGQRYVLGVVGTVVAGGGGIGELLLRGGPGSGRRSA